MTCNVGNGRARPEQLVGVLCESGADLVAIQELSDEQALAISCELTEVYPFQAMHPGGFAGKALISRFPIQGSEQLFLSKVRPDLKVITDIYGNSLTFLVVHPPPPHPHWSGVRFDSDTWNQIRTLAQIAVNNPPTVLLGDFNLGEWSREYTFLRDMSLKDAYRECESNRGYTLPKRIGPWRRFLWLNRLLSGFMFYPVLRVDYIWVTKQFECQRAWIGQDTGSDHLPVLATLNLKEGQST